MTDQVKAREFWLVKAGPKSFDHYVLYLPPLPPKHEVIHVIEKSAYESVVRERDELREKQDKFNHSRFAQLERNISIKDAEIAKLKQSLDICKRQRNEWIKAAHINDQSICSRSVFVVKVEHEVINADKALGGGDEQ